MDKIISPNNIEYQEYLSEFSLFLKNKNDIEQYIKKKKPSNYVEKISYTINEKGDIIKEDKNRGDIIKIIKPSYIDIFNEIGNLEVEKEKYKILLIRMRDEVLIYNKNDTEYNNQFRINQEKYNGINKNIQELRDYYNKVNNVIEVQTEIQRLELEKDIYQEKQRELFSELKLLSSDTLEWIQLSRKYFSCDKDSDRTKLKEINDKISKLTRILFYEELEDESNHRYMIKPGKVISEEVFAGDIENENIIPRLPIYFEMKSLPVIEKSTELQSKIKSSIKVSTETIFFNIRIKDFNFLSNYSNNSFKSIIYGFPLGSEIFEWPTVEHYFQASKYSMQNDINIEYIKEILKQKTPALATKMGSNRQPSNGAKLREDWDTETEKSIGDIILKNKDLVMMKAIEEKFSQNKDIENKLLETYPKILINKSTSDNYWGSGQKGDGLNMLGKIIMNYRDSVIENYSDSNNSFSNNSNVTSSSENTNDTSSEKVIVNKSKQTKKTTKANSVSSDTGGSILKLKGTYKNTKNISWNKEDSLGNKLNDSNYELDKSLTSLDFKNLDLDFMSLNEEQLIIPGTQKNESKEIINEIDLHTILSRDLDIIDINNLNTDNLNIDNNSKNIKNINIKLNDNKNLESIHLSDKNKTKDINFINLMDSSLQKNDNSSNLKNIIVKLR